MNFLDAHKIFYDYVAVFADGAPGADSMLRIPISKLPFNGDGWKDDVIAAYQIFLSHTILWNTREDGFLEKSMHLLGNIDFFTDDATVDQIKKDFHMMKKKNSIYGLLHKKDVDFATERCMRLVPNLLHTYRYDDVENTITGMIEYKNTNFLPNFAKAEDKKQALTAGLKDYCMETYRMAGIPYREEYINFFWRFETLREYLTRDETKGFFTGYEEYIMAGN